MTNKQQSSPENSKEEFRERNKEETVKKREREARNGILTGDTNKERNKHESLILAQDERWRRA